MSPEDKKQVIMAVLICAAALIVLVAALTFWVFTGTISSITSAVKQHADEVDPLVNEKENQK